MRKELEDKLVNLSQSMWMSILKMGRYICNRGRNIVRSI